MPFHFKNLEIMGGEGSMMAANNSLKNNRSLLSKRKEKSGLSGSYSNVKLADFPEATPQELMRIKKKIQRDNKQEKVKQLVLFIVLIIIVICVLLI